MSRSSSEGPGRGTFEQGFAFILPRPGVTMSHMTVPSSTNQQRKPNDAKTQIYTGYSFIDQTRVASYVGSIQRPVPAQKKAPPQFWGTTVRPVQSRGNKRFLQPPILTSYPERRRGLPDFDGDDKTQEYECQPKPDRPPPAFCRPWRAIEILVAMRETHAVPRYPVNLPVLSNRGKPEIWNSWH